VPPSPAEAVRHYLDHASTTPLRPAAAASMVDWIERLGQADGAGDPSRVHLEGREVREAIEISREQVAALAGVPPSRVVFTSGATEAANAAVFSVGPALSLCARVEHSSVREASLRAGEVTEIAVGSDGMLDVEHLRALLSRATRSGADRLLVHCQHANHEVGTVQPVAEVAALCAEVGVPLHVDAAAAFGHVPFGYGSLGAAFVSVSAHKMGGPPGVGALLLGRGVRVRPLLVGASEERGRRAGAENVLGIVGFGAAAAELSAGDDSGSGSLLESEAAREASLRDSLASVATAVAGVSVLGPAGGEERLPHILCLDMEGVLGEAVLLSLDAAGIAAHSGSACSSEVLEPSPVLEAMGADPDRSLRLSVGWSSSEEDVAAFGAVFPEVLARLRSLASGGSGGN
jgi:cysteine desulfurase